MGAEIKGGNVTVQAYKTATFTNSGKVFNTSGIIAPAAGSQGNVIVNAGTNVLSNTAAPVLTTTVLSDVVTNTVSAGNTDLKQVKKSVTNYGGSATFTNNAGGYIGGSVQVNGPATATATVVNAGQVAGTTTAGSEQSTVDLIAQNVVNVATSGTITTTTTTKTTSDITAATGGAVDGTYSGVNGEVNFAPLSAGTVTQTANKSSKAVVSGTIYGNLTSTAGTGTNSDVQSSQKNVTVVDTATAPPSGSTNVTNTKTTTTKSTAGGDSTVTVSGKVTHMDAGAVVAGLAGLGNVTSTGTDSSTVTVSGSTGGSSAGQSSGSVTSTASGAFNTVVRAAGDNVSYSQTNTKGDTKTTKADDVASTVTTRTGGAAVGDVTGTGSVGTSLTVAGFRFG